MSDGQESTTGFFGDLSREPDGRPQNWIWLGTAVLFYALTAWGLLAEPGGFVLFTPLFATGFALSGVAESLPAERQQAVYWTRVLATALMLVLFVVFLVGLLGGPELLR